MFGIVQGGVHEDLRRESAEAVSAAGVDGLAIGGTLGRDKAEMREVLAMTAPLLPEDAPKHLLGIGEVDDLLAGIALGLDVFDCAVPTRLARHGVALVPDPENRFRLDLRKAGFEGDRDPIVDGCPCPACQHHDRDYLSYLSRAEELTAVRLLCLHNLTYLHELVEGTQGDRGGTRGNTRTPCSRARRRGRVKRAGPVAGVGVSGFALVFRLESLQFALESIGRKTRRRAAPDTPTPTPPARDTALFRVLFDQALNSSTTLSTVFAGHFLDLDAGGLVGGVDDGRGYGGGD